MMEQKNYWERHWVQILVVVVSSILLMYIQSIILGGHKLQGLQSAPALSGQISQALTGNTSATLPTINKDFTLQDTRYFENSEWVVTTITPTQDSQINESIVVMRKKHGVYTAVLGPGTSFPRTITQGLPGDIQLYLYGLGATYGN